MAHYRAINQRL